MDLRPLLRSQVEPSGRLRLMSIVMVTSHHHFSDAATDQRDETSAEQDADDLHRPFCPAIHFRDCHEADRRFAVDELALAVGRLGVCPTELEKEKGRQLFL